MLGRMLALVWDLSSGVSDMKTLLINIQGQKVVRDMVVAVDKHGSL